jgi:hypothetical protein
MRGVSFRFSILLALGIVISAPVVSAAEKGEIEKVLTESTSTPQGAVEKFLPTSTKKPSLYVHTGYELGTLYKPPKFPKRVALDNHDYISNLRWKIQTRSARAVGVLHENKCRPSCANGSFVTYPVEIRASAPKHCSVEIHKPYSDVSRTERAYVFNKIYVRALRGKPAAGLVGPDVFSPACR